MRWRIFQFIMMLIIILPSFQTLFCREEDNTNIAADEVTINNEIFNKSYFIRNNGQWEEKLSFIGKTEFGHIGLCNDEIIYHISNIENSNQSAQYNYVFKLSFINANEIYPTGRKILNENITYIYGNSSENVFSTESYNSVYYHNIWDNIDIEFLHSNNHIKYNYIVHPGGDVENIKIQVDGAEPRKYKDDLLCYQLDDDVNLFEKIPLSYYLECDEDTYYSYEISSENVIGINFENRLSDKTLIIDPLIFSTYIGGRRLDAGSSIVLDKYENSIITGRTESTYFPTTTGAYSEEGNGRYDAFISKLNRSGASLDFSTFIGGWNHDEGHQILLDKDENIYVIGNTRSDDFPVTDGCYNGTLTNGSAYYSDVFIICMNSNGSELKYSTLIGGSRYDYGYSLDIDEYGNIYGTGWTESNDGSNDFPTTSSCYDSTYNGGESDAFLFKMNSNLSKLLYSTYIGGSDDEWGLSLRCSSSNIVYITGITSSSNFPTSSKAYDRQLSCFIYGNDCFILKMNISTSTLDYSTYLGGTNNQWAHSIDIDENGNAYITGVTWSSNFPTTVGSYDTTYNQGGDIFITKLNWNGTKLLYSTFIGGGSGDIAYSIVLDGAKNIYVTGYTHSSDFPTINGSYSTIKKGDITYTDCFIFKLNITNNELLYSSYIGGTEYDSTLVGKNDKGMDLCINKIGEVIIVGYSRSTDFPTTHEAFNTTNSGDIDVFVFHLNLTLKARPPINLTGTIGNGYVQLKWGNPNGAYNISVDGYSVYRGLSDKNLDLIATFINDTEYNDTTIQNGLGYYYHVTCFNGAGESDPSDTIYVIDTISPKIIMDMSDSYATTGDIFHFLVIAIDNVLVSNVIVEYWIGEEEHAIDIMQSTDAIRWSSSIIIPDKDSALSYFFNATDLNFNYINSSEYSVIISDNDIPIFGEDTSDNIGSTGDIFKFSINITDNIFVNRSYVRYGINDESINNTENLFIGPDDFYSIITIPDYSISLRYEFIALDKDKNENRTEIKTINIVDDDKPFIVDDLSDELVYTSDVFTFNIIVADNIKVNDVFVKYTMGNIKGNNTLLYDGNSWKYSINTSSEPGSITYSYRIVDSSDNWLISDHMEVPIIDNELPLIFNDQSNNIAYTGDVFYFMADIYDNGIVNDAFVHYWYGNGYQNNISLIRYDINKYQTDIIINGNSLENLYYKFVVIDEYGNVNVTSIFTVVIEDNDMPIIISVTHTNQPINTGDIYNVQVIAEDNIEISKITLYWKQDLNEYHTFDLTEIDGKYGYTIQVKMNSTLPIYYHVQIMDSSNNINSSIVYELFIVDNIPPEISSIPDISINVSSILKLNITVYDNIGIQSIVWDDAPFNFSGYEYCDYVNVSGYFTINISVIDLEGNYAFTTFNLTVLPDKTDNNQNNSQIETIERNYLSIIIIIVSIIFLLCISVIIGWFVIINKRTKNNENEDIIVNELDVEKQIIQEEEKSSSININENE